MELQLVKAMYRDYQRNRPMAMLLQLGCAVMLPAVYFAATLWLPLYAAYQVTARESLAVAVALAPIFTFLYMVWSAALLVVLKWLVVGRQRERSFAVWSVAYAARHLVVQSFRWTLALSPWGTQSETLWLNAWLRALGANVGHGAAISVNAIEDFDLAVVGARSSVSGSILCAETGTESGRCGVPTSDRIALSAVLSFFLQGRWPKTV